MESFLGKRDPTTKERVDAAARTFYALRHVPFHELMELVKDDSGMNHGQKRQAIAMLGSASAAVTVAQAYLETLDE